MEELSPVHPRNPAQNIAAPNSVSEQEELKDSKKQVHIEDSEYIPLPSRGVFYTWNTKYWNMEQLMVRQLNYLDEDILTTKSYFENGTIYNELLKNVIVDENEFPATGLVPVDRDTLLFWLRSKAFGSLFEIDFKCPQCGEMTEAKWDLSKLEIPQYAPEVYEELKATGEYKLTTPLREVQVRITIPTIGKSMESEKLLTQKKLATKETRDFFGTGSLMLLVVGVDVDGKVIRNKNEIQNYFKKINLPISDARYIRKEAEKLKLKYETAQNIVCGNDSCKHVEEGVELPLLHANFFWFNVE